MSVSNTPLRIKPNSNGSAPSSNSQGPEISHVTADGEVLPANMAFVNGYPAYAITHIKPGRDENGRLNGMVELFSSPLRYYVLRLFETQRPLLARFGIDPATIDETPVQYVNFYATFVEKDKLNPKGNPYRDVLDLFPNPNAPPLARAQDIGPLAEILEDIRDEMADMATLLRNTLKALTGSVTSTAPPATPPAPSETPVTEQPVPPAAVVDTRGRREELLAIVGGKEAYEKCMALLGHEPHKASRTDDFWQLCVRYFMVSPIADAYRMAANRICETWGPDDDWQPMVFAMGAYLAQDRNTPEQKVEALAKAQGIYFSLT